MADRQSGGTETESTNRGRAAEALNSARERTVSAYEAARGRTRETARQVTDQMAVYPLGAVLGGLAVGAALAFLVPRTRRETELLGQTGRKLTAAAREAAQKGMDAGRERIDTLAGKAVSKVSSAVSEVVGAKD